MTTKPTVQISRELRSIVELRREESGRTVTDEVEATLRHAYREPASPGLLLIHLDDGLMAHLVALQSVHFVGDLEALVIFMLRHELLNGYLANEHWRSAIKSKLPSKYR